LNTAPVMDAQLRNVSTPSELSAGTSDSRASGMACRATPQYNNNEAAPVQPPKDKANFVPNRSLNNPGIQLKRPATKNAVLMVLSSLCVKPKFSFRADAYAPNAYDVPPVVADAEKAQTNDGIFEMVGCSSASLPSLSSSSLARDRVLLLVLCASSSATTACRPPFSVSTTGMDDADKRPIYQSITEREKVEVQWNTKHIR
jgi:hypothetical protein